MKPTPSTGLAWVAVAVLLCAAAVLGAAPARGELALQISTDKTQYLVDEPLYVTVTVRNVGKQDTQIVRLFHPGDLLSFEIVPPDGKPYEYAPWVAFSMLPGGFERAAGRLLPGEQYSAAVDLTYDGTRGTVLSRAGPYTIRGRYAIRDGLPGGPVDARSDELRLTVKEPEGVDRAAHDVLRKGARTHDRGPWNAAAEQRACYERALREFPRSRYAPYVRFYLAQVYDCDGTFSFRNLRGTKKGEALIRRAAGLFLVVAKEASGTPLGAEAIRLAASRFAGVGDVARAQALFEEAFTSPRATDEDRLEVLSSLGHLESGLYQHESGLAPEMKITRLRLPLRRFAEAMGLSVAWDPKTKSLRLRGPKVQAGLKPGEYSMYISGGFRTDVTVSVKDGRTLVSRSVIAALMAAQQGKDASRQF